MVKTRAHLNNSPLNITTRNVAAAQEGNFYTGIMIIYESNNKKEPLHLEKPVADLPKLLERCHSCCLAPRLLLEG